MTVLWPTLILLASVVILGADEASTMICAFSKKDIVKNRKVDSAAEEDTGNSHSLSENIVYSNSTEYCVKDSDSCYALWQEDPVNKSITILTQGCWDSSGDANCEASECIANKKPSKALNNSKFCCCSGNFCNVNVTDGYVYVPEPPTAESKPPSTFGKPGVDSAQLAILLIVLTALICLVTAGSFAYRFYWSNHKRSSDSLHLMEAPPPPSPAFDLDSLNSQEIIGCGRYGSVYRGTLHDHTVAIKIFAYQNRQYFYNERDIYTLPHMDHPDLLKYIGSGERIGADGRPEYLLVLSYTPIGSLHSFVSSNTFDWGRLCKMALSVTQGLAQLHTEIRKGDVFKPCIAHRDLTSRNILVKANGSCMLCDFGFAIRIAGSKYYQNGEEQIAETTSLADVGTLRYMAPEILEGAVNLRDCEASLKQIDVYALGLVLWEIATRCSDLFQGMEVPDYKLPFEAEIGIHPTMEQMQVLVTRHKARPLFPDIWKDTNPAVRALKETIEDCWDQDAEARLTTSCVKERLSELPVLWERHKAGLGVPGVSPTVNLTSNHQKQFSVNQTYVTENSLTSEVLNNGTDLQPCSRERIGSLSEATTVTLLSPSESLSQSSSIGNPAGNIKNCIANNSAHASRVSVPLQPHQGRNPCLERNLMMEPLDEVSISGNTFLERPSKLAMNGRISSFSDGDTDIFDYASLPDNTESNYFVSGDLLSHSSRVCNPIPYVQNAVHLASTIPKQPNVPGNGHSLNAQEESKAKENKHWGPLNFFDKKRSKDSFRAGLKSLLERKSHSENRTLSEEQQPLKGFSAGNGYSPNIPCVMGGKLGQTNPINCYWASEDNKELERLVDTEVRILKSDCSSTLVRPVNNLNVEEKDEFIKPMEKITDSKSNTPVKDISNPDVIESSAHVEEKKVPADKTKRPTSLPVQGYPNGSFEDKDNGENSDYEDGKLVLHNTVDNNPVVTMRRKGSSGKRKGVKRVKTPFEIKGRFSLYDDRIMSSQELPSSQGKVVQQPQWDGVTKFSASVPMGMNILCSSQSSNSVQINRMHLNKLQQISKTNGLKLPVSRDQHQTVHSLCDI